MSEAEAILVVEHDRDLARAVQDSLQRDGYAVRHAATAADARRALQEPVAVLVLDLGLSGADPLALLREATRLPMAPDVIVTTAQASIDSAIVAIDCGAAGYLVKPYAISRLEELVGRVIERRGLVRENERLNTELANRLVEAESLLAVASTIGSTLDLSEALRRICRELVRLTEADTAAAYLFDAGQELLVPTAAYRAPKEYLELLGQSTIPLREQGFYLPLWTTRRPVHSEDVTRDPRFSHALFREIPHQSGLVLPLVLDDEVAGAFYLVWWKARRTFADRELDVLERVSGQAGLLLLNSRLFERAERDRRRLETLHTVARRLAVVHETDQILALIVEEATRLLGAAGAGIRLVEGDDLVLSARTESLAGVMGNARVKVGRSLSGRALATGEPVAVEDLADDSIADPRYRGAALDRGLRGFLAVPLRAHGRLIGVLSVFTAGPRRFDAEEVSLLAVFADHASLAIEKGRLLRGAEEGRRLLARLYEVALSMQTSWDREERLRAFVRGVVEVVGFDRVQVFLTTPDATGLELATAHGESGGSLPPPLPLTPAAGAYFLAFHSRELQAVLTDEDLERLPPRDPAILAHQAFRTRRFLVAPLVVGDRVIGVVGADNKPTRRPIDRNAMEPFRLLCQQLAMALEEARLYGEARAREREATRLYEITGQLAASLDLNRTLDLITAKTLELLSCDASGIYQYDEEKGELRFLRGLRLDPALTRSLVLRPGEGVAGRAFQERRPVWTRDQFADRDLAYPPAAADLVRKLAPRAFLGVPIISHRQTYGVLVAYFFAAHDFSPKEIQLLSTLADQAAITVENARLYAETRTREQEATRLARGLTLLNEASRALYRTLEVDAMLHGALDELAAAFGADAAMVNLIAESGAVRSVGRWLSEAHGADVGFRPRGGVTELVRDTREPLVLRDIGDRPDVVHPAHFAHGVRSLAALPVVGQGGRVLGVLFLYYTTSQSFPSGEVHLLTAYAGQLATALENAQLYEEAQGQRTRLRLIFDSTSDGIVLLGPDGRIEAANERAGELLGFDGPPTPGTSLVEALARRARTPADAARMQKTFGQLLAAPERGGGGDLELLGPLLRVLQWTAQPTRSPAGATIGLTLTFRDVTEERMVSQMKSDFVSFVTHQLRTPLAGIKWLLELTVQGSDLPDAARSFVEDAREANERLIRLVNDLLNVSRLESGKIEMTPEPTDFRELTASVVADLQGLVRDKGHHLTLVADPLPLLRVDRQLLRQVILNLLANAIKYTKPGGRVAVHIARRDAEAWWAVRDSGIGIPKDAQRRLFEKFYRAENAMTLETEGTGLGLYLVRLIVEQCGGRIWCESEEGQGSTFVFTLPLPGEDR
jgi:PAS domain S-box-containing protein